MKSCKHKIGVTLVEMLVVVALITLLAAMVVGVAGRINTQGKERLTESALVLLDAALGQFQDYKYRYKNDPSDDEKRLFYLELDFPLDCNDLSQFDLEARLDEALNVNVSISGAHEPNYSGSEALYFFLSRVPASRKTLDRIDSSLITNKGSDGNRMEIDIDGEVYPLVRVIDPWGKPLRYDYYDETESDFQKRGKGKRTFPLITSAGPDGIFNTTDDITNR